MAKRRHKSPAVLAAQKRAVDAANRKTAARNAVRDRTFDKVIAPAVPWAFNEGVRFFWQLADWLNERKLLTWRGEPWTAQRVDAAFRRQHRRLLDEVGIKSGPRPCPICFMTTRTRCSIPGGWCQGRFTVGRRRERKTEKVRLLAAPRQALIGMTEEWRRDPAFGIEVSNRGRVRKRVLLETKLSPTGDPLVDVGTAMIPIAYLVATNFHGPPVKRNETIQFLDGNRWNVDAANLGWTTRRQNTSQ